jgi:hypothetical protein
MKSGGQRLMRRLFSCDGANIVDGISEPRMNSTKRRYSRGEFARRGDDIFANAIRPNLTSGHEGKFVAIDIGTVSMRLPQLN